MRDAHNTAIRDRSVTGCWAHRSGTSLLPCNQPRGGRRPRPVRAAPGAVAEGPCVTWTPDTPSPRPSLSAAERRWLQQTLSDRKPSRRQVEKAAEDLRHHADLVAKGLLAATAAEPPPGPRYDTGPITGGDVTDRVLSAIEATRHAMDRVGGRYAALLAGEDSVAELLADLGDVQDGRATAADNLAGLNAWQTSWRAAVSHVALWHDHAARTIPDLWGARFREGAEPVLLLHWTDQTAALARRMRALSAAVAQWTSEQHPNAGKAPKTCSECGRLSDGRSKCGRCRVRDHRARKAG